MSKSRLKIYVRNNHVVVAIMKKIKVENNSSVMESSHFNRIKNDNLKEGTTNKKKKKQKLPGEIKHSEHNVCFIISYPVF